MRSLREGFGYWLRLRLWVVELPPPLASTVPPLLVAPAVPVAPRPVSTVPALLEAA